MDFDILLIIGSVLVVLGVVGSIIPAMPGPALSFIGLLLLYFGKPDSVSFISLILFGLAMVILTIIDYVAPILGAKFSGASRYGLIGAVAGCLIGIIFFPPLGIFIGAFLGAFLGEMVDGKKPLSALKAGVGTLIGSVFVIILQVIFSLSLAVYFFINLLN